MRRRTRRTIVWVVVGVVVSFDGIVTEPVGGAHRDPEAVIRSAGDAMNAALIRYIGLSPQSVRMAREEKFLAMGRRL